MEKSNQPIKQPPPSHSSTETDDLQRGNRLHPLPWHPSDVLPGHTHGFILDPESADEEVAVKSCPGLRPPSAGIYAQGHLFMARTAEAGGTDRKNRGEYIFLPLLQANRWRLCQI